MNPGNGRLHNKNRLQSTMNSTDCQTLGSKLPSFTPLTILRINLDHKEAVEIVRAI